MKQTNDGVVHARIEFNRASNGIEMTPINRAHETTDGCSAPPAGRIHSNGASAELPLQLASATNAVARLPVGQGRRRRRRCAPRHARPRLELLPASP